MGLTIHYNLKAGSISPRDARSLVERMHSVAKEIPFQSVSEVKEFVGDQCLLSHSMTDDDTSWMLIQAQQGVTFGGGSNLRVIPKHVIVFEAWPGEGCEPANFGLATYPSRATYNGETKRTNLSGWRWHSFCKTQYASNPERGGVEHFLACHLCVITALDGFGRLLKVGVHDEGHYWEKRDIRSLSEEVGEWNEMVAAFAGKIMDEFGECKVSSEIAKFPNFGVLEATGQVDVMSRNKGRRQSLREVRAQRAHER